MVCATNPESFGLAPPTGSEDKKYDVRRPIFKYLAAVDAVPQAPTYDTDTEKRY